MYNCLGRSVPEIHCHVAGMLNNQPTTTAPPCCPNGKTSASRVAYPGFDSCCRSGSFSRLSHTTDLNIGSPVATLPGAWCYRVSAGTGQPCVSILWLGEMASLICSFYPRAAACKIVWADLSERYTGMLLGHQSTSQQVQSAAVSVLGLRASVEPPPGRAVSGVSGHWKQGRIAGGGWGNVGQGHKCSGLCSSLGNGTDGHIWRDSQFGELNWQPHLKGDTVWGMELTATSEERQFGELNWQPHLKGDTVWGMELTATSEERQFGELNWQPHLKGDTVWGMELTAASEGRQFGELNWQPHLKGDTVWGIELTATSEGRQFGELNWQPHLKGDSLGNWTDSHIWRETQFGEWNWQLLLKGDTVWGIELTATSEGRHSLGNGTDSHIWRETVWGMELTAASEGRHSLGNGTDSHIWREIQFGEWNW